MMNLLPETINGARPGVITGEHPSPGQGPPIDVVSPVDGRTIDRVGSADPCEVAGVVELSVDAFRSWRVVPAPQRGEFVNRIGQLVRQYKSELSQIISLEAGKIRSEAEGEIQEWIDMCDFAVGLSRQLYGLTIASERPQHQLLEQWLPLGPVGVISAFNFPAAVWAWNAMLALVCGDSIIWKPSEKTPLTALACHNMVCAAASEMPDVPDAISSVIHGAADVGQSLSQNPALPLISATGSIRMGKQVAETVGRRLGRCLLELGGNNAMIVTPSADRDLAVRAIVFAAVGTCGQRCTSLRRLIVHDSIIDELIGRLSRVYHGLPIGNPCDPGVLVGPLIDETSFARMQAAISTAVDEGGELICGGSRVTENVPGGVYVRPAIVRMPKQTEIMKDETFAPLLYVVPYRDLEEAIFIQNDVPQGLSSAIFTNDLREAGIFTGPAGSDCGIANVNIGTSGAEIGGAFGGEKETGGGRESGSDSWKAYMRRATNTVNYSRELPLAQGIRFDLN